MTSSNILVKCCRCRNKHTVADRKDKPAERSGGLSMTESVCPRCGCTSYYDYSPQVACCWASGLIEIGDKLPSADAIEIARGPRYALEAQISVFARHGKGDSAGKLLVPGVPEAIDQLAGLEALSQWLRRINTRKPRDGVMFSKEVA